jgi:transcriptional regulator with GAF, ATPase, and Fis domain
VLACEFDGFNESSAAALPAAAAPRREARRQQPNAESRDTMLFGTSRAMAELATVMTCVADTDVAVLIQGETGTGKELVARALAKSSVRRGMPFIKVNCAALPGDLFESELFGFERGAFTGAVHSMAGKFDMANQGTIFLDEIGEVPLSHQSKLLQVLQDGHYSRVGGHGESRSTARVIAATNRDLWRDVLEGAFREDLLFRLNVIPLRVPALRDRKGDIPLLMEFFAKRWAARHNRPLIALSSEFVERCTQYHWPGNIRELENVIQRVVLAGSEEPVRRMLAARAVVTDADMRPVAQVASPPPASAVAPPAFAGLRSLKHASREAARQAEGACIERMLRETQGNRRQAALNLGICYKSFRSKAKQHGL